MNRTQRAALTVIVVAAVIAALVTYAYLSTRGEAI